MFLKNIVNIFCVVSAVSTFKLNSNHGEYLFEEIQQEDDSIFSDRTNIVKRLAEKNMAEQSYKFNHPPFEKAIEQIPVAVIYDGNQNIVNSKNKVKSINKAEIEIKDTSPSVLPTTSNKEATTTPKIPEFTDKNTEKYELDTTKEMIKEGSRLKSRYMQFAQIPVSIVYEERDNTHKNNNRARNLRVTNTNQKTIETVKDNIDINSKKNIISSNPLKNNEHANINRSDTTNQLLRDVDKTDTSTSKSRKNGERDPVVPIIVSENQIYSQTGKFQYSYEGGDGTKAFEKGILKEFDDERTGEAVVGGFSYKDKDGNDFMISYTADENGYRPSGAHLPTPPPIPPAIARALRYLATKTTPEPVTESARVMS